MAQNSPFSLHSLVEDIMIVLISFLEPPTILTFSQTCRRFYGLTQLRVVWANACTHHVLAQGYIFPSTPPILDIPTDHLRACVLHAYRLSRRWVLAQRLNGLAGELERNRKEEAGKLRPRSCTYIEQTTGTSVSEVRFLPYATQDPLASGRHLVVTLGKSVWSVLSLWSVTSPRRGHGEALSIKIAEWGPRGAIFTGFVVNNIPDSEATMAISFQLHEQYFVKLLSVSYDPDFDSDRVPYEITELHTMRTTFVPKTLSGDLLVLADDDAWVEMWDWRAGTCAVLEHVDGQGTIQTNECLQVFLSPESNSVIVARARSLHIFPWPHLTLDSSGESGNTHDSVDTNPNIYRPLASHSFGWVDGMAINIRPGRTSGLNGRSEDRSCPFPAFNILVRGESDDPWANDVQWLQVWTLVPNPEYYAPLACGQSQVDSSQPPPSGAFPIHSDALDPASLPSIPAFSSSPPSFAPNHGSSIPPTHANTAESVTPPAPPSPYIFPPSLETTIPCLHGALRCKQIALGRFGTAVWIRPPARHGWGAGDWEYPNAYAGGADLGLTVLTEDVSSAGGVIGMLPSALGSQPRHDGPFRDLNTNSEMLVGVSLNEQWRYDSESPTSEQWSAALQGNSRPAPAEQTREAVRAVPILANDAATSWSAFDYDEVHGRVALASSFGRVVVLEL